MYVTYVYQYIYFHTHNLVTWQFGCTFGICIVSQGIKFMAFAYLEIIEEVFAKK